MPATREIPPRPAGTTRILAFSDWRVQDHDDLVHVLERIGSVDYIIYAGDDLDRFHRDGRNYLQRLSRFATQPMVLAVAGNDDHPAVRDTLLRAPAAHDLHRSPFIDSRFAFLGNEGCTSGPIATIMHTEDEVRDNLQAQTASVTKRKGERIKILVTHTPPHGVLDIGRRFGAEHIGSKSVTEFLQKEDITLTICGHCHGYGGETAQPPGMGTVLNIASHDDARAEAKLAIIDIDREGGVSIISTTSEDLLERHELGRLVQVGPRRVKHLVDLGITSLAHITEDARPTLRLVPGVGDWHVDRWLHQASLLRGERQDTLVLNPSNLEFLRHPRLIVWDIETDHMQERVWLIGAKDLETSEIFQSFDPDDERACLKSFCEWLTRRPDHRLVSYSGSRFEPRTLLPALDRNRLVKYAKRVAADHDLGHHIQVDMVGPYREFELKKLARQMGFTRFRHPEISGLRVGMMYSEYLLTRTAPPSWAPYLEYNEDDVHATAHVLQHLRESIPIVPHMPT